VIPAASTYVLDRAARCARLAGGATYTGTTKHFVRYRDDRSPYGYDVVDLGTHPGNAEFVLHGDEAAQAYLRDGELEVATLIFRLSPRRVPGSERLDDEGRALLYVAVAAGLAHGLIRYLLRNRVRADVAFVDLEKRSAFAAPGEAREYLIVKVIDLPERLVAGLRGVPGVTLLRPAGENVAIEVGYRHPISLSSASSLFQRDRFYLFRGAATRLDVIKGPIVFSSADHLSELRIAQDPRVVEGNASSAASSSLADVGVDIRLVPTQLAPRRVVGTLVGWSEAAFLKKLVYTLPPVLVRGHQIAVTDRGLLLLASDGVDVIPLGTLLTEATQGLLIPLGMDLIPRVPTDVLAAAIGQQVGGKEQGKGGGNLTVFPHQGGPFIVAQSALVPLARRVLAKVPVGEAQAQDAQIAPPSEGARVVNDPVGRFALWGFRKPKPS
jgi:hypothetical protein